MLGPASLRQHLDSKKHQTRQKRKAEDYEPIHLAIGGQVRENFKRDTALWPQFFNQYTCHALNMLVCKLTALLSNFSMVCDWLHPVDLLFKKIMA